VHLNDMYAPPDYSSSTYLLLLISINLVPLLPHERSQTVYFIAQAHDFSHYIDIREKYFAVRAIQT